MSVEKLKQIQAEKGFTIVELLIVIVVIGILAAITIVAFNGITSRANTTTAQSAADSFATKLDAYNAENSTYPVSNASITSVATTNGVATTATSSWYSAQGSAFSATTGAIQLATAGATAMTTLTSSQAKQVYYVPLSSTYGSNTGGCVYYYDFGGSWKSKTVGAASTCATTGSVTGV